jgi:hypothetical protein
MSLKQLLVSSLLVAASLSPLSVDSFPLLTTSTTSHKASSSLSSLSATGSKSNGDNVNVNVNNLVSMGQKAVASALLAATLWSSPAPNLPFMTTQPSSMVANAKEMASGTGSRVNKDAESLLRYGLPINNNEVSDAMPFEPLNDDSILGPLYTVSNLFLISFPGLTDTSIRRRFNTL